MGVGDRFFGGRGVWLKGWYCGVENFLMGRMKVLR